MKNIKEKVLKKLDEYEKKGMLSILEKPEEEIIDLTLAEVGKVIDGFGTFKCGWGDDTCDRIDPQELKQKLGIEVLK